MTATVQVGSVLMDERPGIEQFLNLQSEPYAGQWSVVKDFDGFALERKIHVAGWSFFFMAAEAKAMFFGRPGTTKIRNAVRRILAKLTPQGFNCLEVTGIVEKRFWGVRYATVSAHARHIQRSCYLETARVRRASQLDSEWANG